MGQYESLSHTKWECKYHVVFIPKCRREDCMHSSVVIWEKYFVNWPSKRKVRSRKVTSAGSCPHVDLHPPEVRGVAGDWIYQGKECDPFGPGIRGE